MVLIDLPKTFGLPHTIFQTFTYAVPFLLCVIFLALHSTSQIRLFLASFDRLRFAPLARALYDEQLAYAREGEPQGAWSVLGRPGFDRLALMTGEDLSVLVACRDRAVLYVYAVGIDDLSAHLDDYAAILEEFQ